MGSATGNQSNFRSQGQSAIFYVLTLAVVALTVVILHVTHRVRVNTQTQPTAQPTMHIAATSEPIFATLTAQPTAIPPTIQPTLSNETIEVVTQSGHIGWQLDDASSTLSTVSTDARLNLSFVPSASEILNAPYPEDLILSFWHKRDFPVIGGGRISVDWRISRDDEWHVLWQYIGGMSGAGLVTAPSFKQQGWEYIEVSLAPVANQLPDTIAPDTPIELRLHVVTPRAEHGVQVRHVNLNNRQLRPLPDGFMPDAWRHSSSWKISPDQSMMRYVADKPGFHVVELIPLLDLRNYTTRDTITLTYEEQGRLRVGDRVAVQIRFEVDEPLIECPDQLAQCYGQVYHWSRWETASASIVDGEAYLDDWYTVTLDLSPYAGTNSQVGRRIQIRFVFFTQSIMDGANWAWRNIQIESFSSSP